MYGGSDKNAEGALTPDRRAKHPDIEMLLYSTMPTGESISVILHSRGSLLLSFLLALFLVRQLLLSFRLISLTFVHYSNLKYGEWKRRCCRGYRGMGW
jgi:hypothetical protein